MSYVILTSSSYSNSILYHRFYRTIDKCQFDREIVAVSISIMGRFLSTPNVIAQLALQDRDEFQLVAISALYLTIKIHNEMFLSSGFTRMYHRGYTPLKKLRIWSWLYFRVLHGVSMHPRVFKWYIIYYLWYYQMLTFPNRHGDTF